MLGKISEGTEYLKQEMQIYTELWKDAPEKPEAKYYLWSKHIYEKTKEICKNKYDVDDYWINASLAECCLVIGDEEGYRKYQEIANLYPQVGFEIAQRFLSNIQY